MHWVGKQTFHCWRNWYEHEAGGAHKLLDLKEDAKQWPCSGKSSQAVIESRPQYALITLPDLCNANEVKLTFFFFPNKVNNRVQTIMALMLRLGFTADILYSKHSVCYPWCGHMQVKGWTIFSIRDGTFILQLQPWFESIYEQIIWQIFWFLVWFFFSNLHYYSNLNVLQCFTVKDIWGNCVFLWHFVDKSKNIIHSLIENVYNHHF